MAAIAASNIQQVLHRDSIIQISGFPIEMFRIIGGFAAADTATVTPKRMRRGIKEASCPTGVSDMPTADSNLPSPTNVTFTMRQSAAANQTVDVILVGKQGG